MSDFIEKWVCVYFESIPPKNLVPCEKLFSFSPRIYRHWNNTSRKRNPNFSEMELKILLDEVESHKKYYLVNIEWSWQTILKKRVWEGICEKVNSVSTGHSRTVEELSKKWSTNASDTKKISSNRRVALKTGGGSFPPELIPQQD